MSKLLRLAFVAFWAVAICGCTSPDNKAVMPDNPDPAPAEEAGGNEAMELDLEDDNPGGETAGAEGEGG